MKTAFKAKLIIDSNKFDDMGGMNEFTIRDMRDWINKGEVQVECILNTWEYHPEPIIIIKDL